MADPIVVDVFSDIACPWCFIGKRRLDEAIAERPAGSVQVRWRAYELQPDLPPEGVDRDEHFRAKFGGPERIKMMFDRVSGVGRDVGIDFQWDKQKLASNTFLAHRVVKLASRQGQGSAAKEALFRGHFEQGVNVGDQDAVLALLRAEGVELDYDRLLSELASGEASEEVRADEQMAQQLGVQGVPFFVGSGRYGMSGAGALDEFRRFLDAAASNAGGSL